MILKINNELTELMYCRKHNEWHYLDDEMNCCASEIEGSLEVSIDG